MKKLLGYLRLMRPANVITAVADVMAGIAIAGYFVQLAPGTFGWGTTTDIFPPGYPLVYIHHWALQRRNYPQ